MSLFPLRHALLEGHRPTTAAVRSGVGAAAVGLGLLAAVKTRRRHAEKTASVTNGPESGVTASDGVVLHVEEDGLPDAPLTVVFVHGFAATLEEFGPQRTALRDRARLVLFDLRGHGTSGWGSYRRGTIDQLGDDLFRVLDERAGKSPLVLVGHSLGGMAIMALAAQRPELFGERIVGAALVSTSASPVGVSVVPPWVKTLLRRTGVAWLITRALWLVSPLMDRVRPLDNQLGRRALRHWLFGAAEPPPESLTHVHRDWLRTPHAVASAFYGTLAYERRSHALSALGRIPVAVVGGTADTTIHPRHDRRLAELIGPSAHLVEVTGAGHMVNLTRPEALNRTLRALVDSVSPGVARISPAGG